MKTIRFPNSETIQQPPHILSNAEALRHNDFNFLLLIPSTLHFYFKNVDSKSKTIQVHYITPKIPFRIQTQTLWNAGS